MRRAIRSGAATLRSNPALGLAVTAWAIAAVALVVRLPFGAGTTDEGFYSAMPYGFLLGNKPYRDELAFHQNAAILQLPFFRIYTWLFRSEGIVVFNRCLYAAYIGLCSFLAFRLVRKLTTATAGAWAAALVLSFSYFNLFTLSYNTLGALGLLAGVLLGTHALLEKPRRHLVAASFFFSTAAFAYPTFSLIAVLHQGLVLWRLKKRVAPAEWKRCLLTVAICGATAAAAAAAFLLWVTPAGIARALEFSGAMGYGKRTVFGKLDVFHSELWALWPYLFSYGFVLASFPVVLRLCKRAALPLALLVPSLLIAIYWTTAYGYTFTRAAILLTVSPVLAPVCLALAPEFPHRRLVMEQLWLPGLVSLFIVSYTSANGALAAHLGALPALVSCVVALSALIAERTRVGLSARWGEWLLAGFGAAVLGGQVHSMYNGVYDVEDRLSKQTAWVHRGPMRGTITTPAKALLLEAVDADLKKIEDPSKTFAAFDDFAVAYLSTRMRPRTFTHWVVWVFDAAYSRKISLETYGDPATQPDFVLLLPPSLNKRNGFLRFRRQYQTIIDRPELGYVILQRIAGPPVAPLAAPPRPRRRRH